MNETPMRKARKAAGLSMSELSRRTRIPLSTLYRLDIGGGEGFSLATKKKIADFFKVDFFTMWPEELGKLHRVQMMLGRVEDIELAPARKKRSR